MMLFAPRFAAPVLGVHVLLLSMVTAIQTKGDSQMQLDTPWQKSGKSKYKLDKSNLRKFTQELTNHWDVLYTSTVVVGGQRLAAIVDTGSFEQCVLSTACSVCGDTHLYKISESKKSTPEVLGIQSYGSGTLLTTGVTDEFAVGPIVNAEQSFWAVTDAEMELLQRGGFQVIFGIGPPASALKFARRGTERMRRAFRQYVKGNGNVTAEIREDVARYDGTLANARETKPFVAAMGVERVSICFFKPSGSGGYIVWNDDATELDADMFLEIPVVGKDFWSAELSQVGLSRVTREPDSDIGGVSPFGAPVQLGCGGKGCVAILDTGSSLIAAPSAVVVAVVEVVNSWVASGGTCDDLRKLPSLDFVLGDVRLSLPAESYVGRAFGDLRTDSKAFMPNFRRLKGTQEVNGGTCEVLLADTGDETDDGLIWVLGMPFFRKYYTTFAYKGELAGTMSFSLADSQCQPQHSPTDLHFESSKAGPRPATLHVNASEIILPQSVTRRLPPASVQSRRR